MELNYFSSDTSTYWIYWNGLKWNFWTIGYCAYRRYQTKILSSLCTNKYCQTSLNRALLPSNECLQCGWIFVQILVNPCKNNSKINIYIHLGGRHYSKYSVWINSLHSHINSPTSIPLSQPSRWRHRAQGT